MGDATLSIVKPNNFDSEILNYFQGCLQDDDLVKLLNSGGAACDQSIGELIRFEAEELEYLDG